jgi:hypothetical protein
MLHAFITLYREEIIRCCREKVAARSILTASNLEIDDGVPLFLDQLVDVLRATGKANTRKIDVSAGQRGLDLFVQGLTVSQVIHGYGDICQSITELAMGTNTPFSTEDFQILNRCLDDAIAGAVTMYTSQSERALVGPARRHTGEELAFLMYELRRLVSTAVTAFDVLRTGNAVVSGSTGTVLKRSLAGLQQLADQSLTYLPPTQGLANNHRISSTDSIEKVAAAISQTRPLPRSGARIEQKIPPRIAPFDASGASDRLPNAIHNGTEIRLVLRGSDNEGWTAHSVITPPSSSGKPDAAASVTLAETYVFSTKELAGQVAYDAACNHIDRVLRRHVK